MNTRTTTDFEFDIPDAGEFDPDPIREFEPGEFARILRSIPVHVALVDKNGRRRTLDEALEEAVAQRSTDLFFTPERAVFNGPATILFWPDGDKTVVQCQPGDTFDPEKGIAMAILKKIYGGGRYNDVLRQLIENN